MTELSEAITERSWWRRIGKIVGSTLHGWSGYASAGFVNPDVDISGIVAEVLLKQQDEIERLQLSIKRKQIDVDDAPRRKRAATVKARAGG